jgi:ankyrin repeat protein
MREIVALLSDERDPGADPNHRTSDYDPQTPLLMAARSGNRELLELLRKHGARY